MNEELNEESKEKRSTGRWLFAFEIVVWLGALVGGITIVLNINDLLAPGTLTSSDLILTTIAIIENIAAILLVPLFQKRKKMFVTVLVWLLVYHVIYGAYVALVIPHSNYYFQAAFYSALLWIVVWVSCIVYMLRSKRVKNIFVG